MATLALARNCNQPRLGALDWEVFEIPNLPIYRPLYRGRGSTAARSPDPRNFRMLDTWAGADPAGGPYWQLVEQLLRVRGMVFPHSWTGGFLFRH